MKKNLAARFVQNLSLVISFRRYRLLGIAAAIIYVFVFLVTINDIIFSIEPLSPAIQVPSAQVAQNWLSVVWKERAPFYYEPIAALYPTRNIMMFVSIPNILIGSALATLIGLNISVAAYSFAVKYCEVKSVKTKARSTFVSFFGVIPSFFAGTACCAPTLTIILGANIGVNLALIALRGFLIPASIVALAAGLVWGILRISRLPSHPQSLPLVKVSEEP